MNLRPIRAEEVAPTKNFPPVQQITYTVAQLAQHSDKVLCVGLIIKSYCLIFLTPARSFSSQVKNKQLFQIRRDLAPLTR